MNVIQPIQPRFTYFDLKKLPDVLTYYYGYKMTVPEVAKQINLSTYKVSDLLKVYGKGLDKKAKRKPLMCD